MAYRIARPGRGLNNGRMSTQRLQANHTRRIRRAIVIAIALLFLPIAQAEPRPNILFILVDDLGKEWIGAYGSESVETPNIDALAESGMRFENAYSMPQCTPSRATLLTGQYPWRTGWVNHWDVPRWGVGYFDWEAYTTFPMLLDDAGYATCAAGKWQINDFRLEPEAMRKQGFDDWCMWTGYETGNPPSGERYWNPYVNTPAGSRTVKDAFGPEVYTDHLMRFMSRHRDEPMLLYYAMALTHTPFTTTPHARDAEGKQAQHKAMVEYTDHLVGRLVDHLTELGLRERTYIVFTTDNGSTRGVDGVRHGKTVAGAKAQKTEAGVCAPFIVSAPGRVSPGSRTQALTDFTDILPTFAEIAGVALPTPDTIDGQSILPVLTGVTDALPRAWILAMGHGPAILDADGIRGKHDFASRVIRDDRYKVWIDESREIVRLHDLQEDPGEEQNLLDGDTTNYEAVLKKFRHALERMPEKDARPKYRQRAPNAWD